MPRSFLDTVLRGAEALAARDPVNGLTDADLLRRFAADRDAAAFAVLVRRHGPLVWGVCRHLLPADADAEDAFQATFLALVRSAGTVRRAETLAGWLHGVAYRIAMKARRAAARRKQREAKAAVPERSVPVPDGAWDELQAAVHEEVCRLPDKLRLPFVLCGLQGRPQKEAAAVLGWKVGTVSGRLTEARRRLLDRLARRGIPAGVAAGAAVLGGVAGQAAVPASMLTNVLSVVGSPAAISPTVLSLARGATAMYLTRTKLLAAGVLLAGALTTGVGVLSKADAQGPAKPGPGAESIQKSADEAVRRHLDALRSRELATDRWEYRFIPIEKPLSIDEFKRTLTGTDRDGWEYCGSQALIGEAAGKAVPHMVFRRPRAVAEQGNSEADAARAAAEVARVNELRARQRAEEERARAEQAAREAARAKAVADERAVLERARAQELEAMKARYVETIRKLEAELKKAKGAADAPVLETFRLSSVKADEVVKALAKTFPDGLFKADPRTNLVIVYGPPKMQADVKKVIAELEASSPGADATGLAVDATGLALARRVSAPGAARAPLLGRGCTGGGESLLPGIDRHPVVGAPTGATCRPPPSRYSSPSSWLDSTPSPCLELP